MEDYLRDGGEEYIGITYRQEATRQDLGRQRNARTAISQSDIRTPLEAIRIYWKS